MGRLRDLIGRRSNRDQCRTDRNFPRGQGAGQAREPATAAGGVAGVAERFWAKVDKTTGPVGVHGRCWLWTGAKSAKGRYGVCWVDGRTMRAHRWAWESVNGPWPDGLYPDHRCHTDDPDCPGGDDCPHRACVRPDHIEPVTHEENGRRANSRRRLSHLSQGDDMSSDLGAAEPVSHGTTSGSDPVTQADDMRRTQGERLGHDLGH